MHIPNGFLDAKTLAATGVLAAGGLAIALRQAQRDLPPRRVPLMGLSAAFIFAAQMLNFPVLAGTSGHLIGGVLAAVLLGPSAAAIVLSTVLLIQCLLFGDGGITALGANIFNMSLVGTVGGWAIYAATSRLLSGRTGRIAAAAFAAWCSVVLASVACAGELAMSGAAPAGAVLPVMAGVHMIIGVGEAIITALVLAAIGQTRPQLLDPADAAPLPLRSLIAYGLIVSLGLAIFVSPFASSWADGLESVAGKLGFEHRAAEQSAPLADYAMPAVPWASLATALAGALGTVVAFALALLLARAVAPKAAPIAQDS